MRRLLLLAAAIAALGLLALATFKSQRSDEVASPSSAVRTTPNVTEVEAQSEAGIQADVFGIAKKGVLSETQALLNPEIAEPEQRLPRTSLIDSAVAGGPSAGVQAVEFLADVPEHFYVRWWCLDEQLEGQREGRQDFFDGVARSELAAGHYVVGLVGSNVLGELVEFHVLDAPLAVQLPDWSSFPMTFQIRDAYTDVALPGAKMQCKRVGIGGDFTAAASRSCVSDGAGMVRFEGLVPGEWVLSSDCEGYVNEEYTLEFPGQWSESLQASGVLDLKAFTVAPLTVVPFVLVGGEPSEDLTAFAISHTHEGEKAFFDLDGHVELVVGWFNEPLYVKLWYPDGRAAVMYLENGLPSAGEPHEIEIGGARELEIDLRFAEEVKKLIEVEENGGLRVSFRPRSGEAKFVGVETKSEGTFTFDDVQAETAVVNFATASDGALPVDWKTIFVELKPSGTTTCSLIVDQRPLFLQFQEEGGVLVSDYTFELRQLPNATSWLAGGVSDEHGLAPCVRVTGREASLFGRIKDTTEKMAIDVPVEMEQARETIAIDLGNREPTFLDVQVDGRPRAGVKFILKGRDTGVAFLEVQSGEDGRTMPTDLLRKSRANAVLASEAYWMPVTAIELQSGRNAIKVYQLGTIKIGDFDQLHRFTHESLRVSPAMWLASGLLRDSDEHAGILSVPAGRYLVDVGKPEERSILVRSGESVDSGL